MGYFRGLLSCLLFAITLQLLFSIPVRAETFCVDSEAELISALNTAEGNNQDDFIRIASGSYSFGQIIGYIGSNNTETFDLSISGGWASRGGCVDQVVDARLTVLDFSAGGAGLYIRPQVNSAIVIAVRNLTIANARPTEAQAIYGGLSFGNTGATVMLLQLSHLRILGCDSSDNSRCGIYVNGNVDIRAVNVLLADNEARSAGVWAQNNSLGSFYGQHLTVMNNRALSTDDAGLDVTGGAPLVLENTIVWNNDNGDGGNNCAIKLATANDRLRHVISDSICGTQSVENVNVNSINPEIADAEYHLADSSPARDAGLLATQYSMPLTDLEGNPRVMGSLPDLGVHENGALFSDGFESP